MLSVNETALVRIHDFGALNTLLFVIILGLCIFFAYLIKQYKFYYLPESGAALLVGLFVGCCARFSSQTEIDFLHFNKLLFYFLLLPPIIFEAGYSVNRRRFFDNFSTILLYAVLGTVVSTFSIGYLTYYAGKLGIIQINTDDPLESLLFGALISAVDPVATLSILGAPELNLDPLLYNLIFGESVLNDAVSIVLFNTFLKFANSNSELTNKKIIYLLFDFILISLGSIGCGLFTGFTCKNTNMHKYPTYEIILLFLFAYGSYAFAEIIGLSGIMSLFFCGIIMSYYNNYNLSKDSQVTSHHIFKSFSLAAEFFTFIYMGLGAGTGQFGQGDIKFMILAIIFCLVSRALSTFPFSILANLRRKQKISLKMQIVLWFAGLRGAIAFALSQNMPTSNRDLYVTTTLAVIMFTTLVCGGLTEPLLLCINLKRDVPISELKHEEEHGLLEWTEIIPNSPFDIKINNNENQNDKKTNEKLNKLIKDDGVPNNPISFWGKMDAQYLRPLFGGITTRRRAVK